MADRPHLTIGISTTPLTRALLDGTVKPDGMDLTCVGAYGKGPASARIAAGELDGGEFSLSSLLQVTEHGMRLAVLPIFLGRDFVHRGFWRHPGAGIESAFDYAGKRLAMHRYNNSYGVWARAVLHDEYGVSPKSIRWYSVVSDLKGEQAPPGVEIERVPGPLSRLPEMLAEGAFDGAIELYLFEPEPGVERLYEDYRAVDAEHYRRTGLFPMYHTIVLRPEVVEQHPRVAADLLEAFRESRRFARDYMTPEELDEAAWQESVLDDDPFAYRIGPSERRAFDAMNRALVREGMLEAPLDADSFFAIKG